MLDAQRVHSDTRGTGPEKAERGEGGKQSAWQDFARQHSPRARVHNGLSSWPAA